MAAVDKIYGNLAEHIALESWVTRKAPALQYCVRTCDTSIPTNNQRPIAQFPIWADEFLLNACEMEWVKDQIRDQYDLPAGATSIHPDTDDADYAQAGDDMLLADIEHLFEERDAKLRQLQGQLAEKTGALEMSNKKRQKLEEQNIALLKENSKLIEQAKAGDGHLADRVRELEGKLHQAHLTINRVTGEAVDYLTERDEARAQRDNLIKEVAVYRADWVEPSIKLQNNVIRDLDTKLRQEQAATKVQATAIADLEAKLAALQRERDEMDAQRKAWANAATADPLASRSPGDSLYYLEYEVRNPNGTRYARGSCYASGPANTARRIAEIMTDKGIDLQDDDNIVVRIYNKKWLDSLGKSNESTQ